MKKTGVACDQSVVTPDPRPPMPMDQHAAFEQLLQQCRPALARLARRYAGPHDYQDLFQEICLQLWRGFPGFDGRSQPSTWAYRVALNTAITHLRKPRREHQALDSIPEPGDAGGLEAAMQLLDAFLASLDPVSRSILLLDLEGCPREQVAEVLGLTPNAVAIRMTRLRQDFERRYVEA